MPCNNTAKTAALGQKTEYSTYAFGKDVKLNYRWHNKIIVRNSGQAAFIALSTNRIDRPGFCLEEYLTTLSTDTLKSETIKLPDRRCISISHFGLLSTFST